MQSRAV